MNTTANTLEPLAKAHASGYPLQGRRVFQGLQVSIENKAGSWRVDKAHNPPQWRTKMELDYGYIRGSEGVDGDHIDVYIGPNEEASHAYIVRQVDPETSKFDEQKVMLGFDSEREAIAAYLRHYDTPKFFGGCRPMPMPEFKRKALASLHGPKLIKSLTSTVDGGELEEPVLDAARAGALLKAITADSRRLEKGEESLIAPDPGADPGGDWLGGYDWQSEPGETAPGARLVVVFTSGALRDALTSRAFNAAVAQAEASGADGAAFLAVAVDAARRRRAQAAFLANVFYGGVVAPRNLPALEAAVDAPPATFDRVLAQLRPDLAVQAPLQAEPQISTSIPAGSDL